VVTADSSGNTVSLLANSGAGTFAAARAYAAGPGLSALAVGDISGDGTPDVVVTNNSLSLARVLINRGRVCAVEP